MRGVQSEFGGTSTTITPEADILNAARHALVAVGELGYRGSYARIDGVRSGGRFLVMEVEMIEPFLFLHASAAASERLPQSSRSNWAWRRPARR